MPLTLAAIIPLAAVAAVALVVVGVVGLVIVIKKRRIVKEKTHCTTTVTTRPTNAHDKRQNGEGLVRTKTVTTRTYVEAQEITGELRLGRGGTINSTSKDYSQATDDVKSVTSASSIQTESAITVSKFGASGLRHRHRKNRCKLCRKQCNIGTITMDCGHMYHMDCLTENDLASKRCPKCYNNQCVACARPCTAAFAKFSCNHFYHMECRTQYQLLMQMCSVCNGNESAETINQPVEVEEEEVVEIPCMTSYIVELPN